MISESIKLEQSDIEKLSENIDEYLCHRRNFSLKITTSDIKIEVIPYKADWLISCYNNNSDLIEQVRAATFEEAFKMFQQLSVVYLQNKNMEYRNET